MQDLKTLVWIHRKWKHKEWNNYLISGLVSLQHRKGVDEGQLGSMIIVKTKQRSSLKPFSFAQRIRSFNLIVNGNKIGRYTLVEIMKLATNEQISWISFFVAFWASSTLTLAQHLKRALAQQLERKEFSRESKVFVLLFTDYSESNSRFSAKNVFDSSEILQWIPNVELLCECHKLRYLNWNLHFIWGLFFSFSLFVNPLIAHVVHILTLTLLSFSYFFMFIFNFEHGLLLSRKSLCILDCNPMNNDANHIMRY